MERFRIAVIMAWSILVGMLSPCSAQSPAQMDTVQAVVIYGDDKLVDSDEALTDDRLQSMLDSLCTLDPAPQDLIRDLRLFQRIRRMEVDQMYALIDSLFDLETVPYALVNEINLYVDQLPSQEDVDRSEVLAWSRTNVEPGGEIYGDWITKDPNAYRTSTLRNDTLFQVRLTDLGSACGFAMPVPPIVTSRFGWRDGRNHNGVDLDLEMGDPVHAAFPGVVRFAGPFGTFGRLVVIRHYNGLETFYAHLRRTKVNSGDVVDAGDVIGLGGSSGHSTGSHLHFETRFNGVPIDPAHYIDLTCGQLICDTLVLKKTRWSYAAYPKGTRFHTVAKGEHLSAIADLYGVPINALCEFNGITPRTRLRVGQRLMVNAHPASDRMAQLR